MSDTKPTDAERVERFLVECDRIGRSMYRQRELQLVAMVRLLRERGTFDPDTELAAIIDGKPEPGPMTQEQIDELNEGCKRADKYFREGGKGFTLEEAIDGKTGEGGKAYASVMEAGNQPPSPCPTCGDTTGVINPKAATCPIWEMIIPCPDCGKEKE